MVEAENVSVRVIRYNDGVPYTEYAPPTTSTGHGTSPNERYIEVSTDERYYIEVKLLRGFKFLGQPKVRVNYTLDNNSYNGILSRSRPADSDRSYRWHREDEVDSVNRIINGKVMECGLMFGQLDPEGDVVLGYKQIAQAVDEAGRIVVKFRRGRFGGKIRESSEPRAFDPLDNVDDTKSCKEVVCKHNVSHVTTHVPLRPAPEAAPPGPGAYEREWIRADEPEGKPIVFTIRYRSRAALVALGIKNDVVDAPSLSGIDDSTDMDLTSIYRATASASPGPLPNPLVIKTSDFQASLDSHSGETHESQECIDDEDSEEDNSSDATIVADGEKSDFDSDPRTGKDAILVSDDEEHIEGNNSGRVPSNRDDPILVTDDKDSDLLKSLERSVEPRQATPVYNADESNPSQSSERPSEPTRPGTPTQSEESARLFAIQNRVKTPFSKNKRRYVPDRAKAVTAVKRKINDGQLEDFFSSKRLTLADATDV